VLSVNACFRLSGDYVVIIAVAGQSKLAGRGLGRRTPEM
jgi:hypothetical protein